MLVKNEYDKIFGKVKEFQEMGLNISFIYVHDSTERILTQEDNVLISENQFEELDPIEIVMKMLFDLDTKPIPINVWTDKISTYKLRLGPKYNVSRLVSALVEKPDKQLSARRINYSKYPKETMKLADVLPFLPIANYIIFTALGSYQDSYNFSSILQTFQTFVQEYQEEHSKTMVLVLGGDYDNERDYQCLCDIRRSYQQLPNSIVYLKQNLSVLEKSTILKNTTGEFDYKAGTENAFNIRLGFRAGVPLLSAPASYSWRFMRNGDFGYLVHVIHDYQTTARLMHKIILKLKSMSSRVRQYSISNMSNMYRVLLEFEEEDRVHQNPGN